MFTKNVNTPEVPRRRGRPPGRTGEGTETRKRLFDTAIALMADRGYVATTLRDVADKAGVSPGLLYRYFSSKQAVVLALCSAFSRLRVQTVFHQAVIGATDVPRPQLAGALGRLLYLLHLAVLLWWLLDKSPRQRATTGLVTLIERAMPSAVVALRFPPVVKILQTGDDLFREALFDGALAESSR